MDYGNLSGEHLSRCPSWLTGRQAANSLAGGMEETLTLHKLGVAGEIGRSLRTTNIIENVNSHLGEQTRRVKRCMTSDQRQP